MSWFKRMFDKKPAQSGQVQPAYARKVGGGAWKQAEGSAKTPATESVVPVPEIIDARRINVVKAHSIIGALDSRMNAKRRARLVAWLRANEKAVAAAALRDGPGMPGHALALRPAVEGGSIAFGPGCVLGDRSCAYIVGDTHGDVDSFTAVLDTVTDIRKAAGPGGPTVYMLGDAVDRAGEGCMLLTVLVMAIMQKALPEEFAAWNDISLGFIKGDHDVALAYPDEYSPEARFSASVTPADYANWLNARLDSDPSEDNTLVGRAWIRLMSECPAAAFLDGPGALLSHGGLPRYDLQERIEKGEPYLFMSGECAADYEWCRMVDVKNKLLNRSSKTSEIGFQEFESFNRLLGGRIRKFIFGHQHPAGGYVRYSKFFGGYDVVCLSSFRDDALPTPSVPYFCKVTDDAVNAYSLAPAAYVVRLEESSSPAAAEPPPVPAAPLPKKSDGASAVYPAWAAGK